MKKQQGLLGAGIMTAIASSLCCVTPVLALISGTSGAASSFSWLEPLRPYLIVFTIFVLAITWYQKLNSKKELDCNCDIEEKTPFMQTKLFLGIVTLFAIVMTAFPYYSSVFYPTDENLIGTITAEDKSTILVQIKGMTCEACELHVNHSVKQLNGIQEVNTSYEDANTKVVFDKTKVNEQKIKEAINATGYTAIKIIQE